jgi:hypothetical protein
MEAIQLIPTVYYALAIIVAIAGSAWKIVHHIDSRVDATAKTNARYHEQRTLAFDTFKTNIDARFELASRRDAELSERITAARLEQYRELGGYVTKADFEKRMDRMQEILETILERLPHARGQRD